jgi:energy-coupling factor transporter ATP-binding protein EcfA2
MGYKLKIRNFGQIRSVSMEIRDISLFVGSQTSGKSAIAKMVYFFLSLRKDIWVYLSTEENRTIPDFERVMRLKFAGLYGSARVNPDFSVKFEYTRKKFIELVPQSNGYIGVRHSEEVKKGLSVIFRKSNELRQIVKPELEWEFQRMTGKLFEQGEKTEIIYIPAGRSILSSLNDFLPQIVNKVPCDNRLLELTLRDFIEKVLLLQRFFDRSLDEVIERNISFLRPNEQPDMHCLNIARNRMEAILKGTYRYDRNGGKITVADAEVHPAFASSGQQESLWIVMTLFRLILKQINAFIFIEEPETHLFPEAQKHITELMALAANLNGNQLMITTHSPYILTTFNTLMYLGRAGKKTMTEMKRTIDQNLWIDVKKVKACLVEDGGIHSVLDEKTALIMTEEIGSISGILTGWKNSGGAENDQ